MINFDVDISGFQDWSRRCIDGLDEDQQLLILRGFAMKFIGTVVPRTPVDTGRVRGGWTAMRGSSRGLSLGPAAAEGRKMSSYREGKGRDAAYVEIFNGVPYVVYLELGSSDQAPSGFVRLTMREMANDLTGDLLEATVEEMTKANDATRKTIGLRQGSGPRSPLGPRAIRNR